MGYTVFDIPIIRSLLQGLSICILRICGWSREGQPPDFPKYIMVAAPHTSNWDFPMGMGILLAFKLKFSVFGKESLFRWPYGGLLKWIGLIPINRSKSCDVVAQTVQIFKDSREMILVISPEGTRRKDIYWKTGFYHIARGANIPIVMAFLDYEKKQGGIGPTLMPTGDIESDMEKIRCFYDKISGKVPEKSTPAIISPRGVNNIKT